MKKVTFEQQKKNRFLLKTFFFIRGLKKIDFSDYSKALRRWSSHIKKLNKEKFLTFTKKEWNKLIIIKIM